MAPGVCKAMSASQDLRSESKDPPRCPWQSPFTDPLMLTYHDREWGVPQHDDRLLFESLVLDGFQAGLSWTTILKKREAFRQAFDGFDPARVAQYDEQKTKQLLADPGIVRNRAKISATIQNARALLTIQAEQGSFDAYIWSFVGGQPKVNSWRTLGEFPAKTPESEALSKDLKRRGFRFVGPTICYAFMQAVGLVNDHTVECFRYRELVAGG